MTDNGSAYRSKLFASALRDAGARNVLTRPYAPRANGKAERFIQITLPEWAYARPYASPDQRAAAIKPWTDDDNLSDHAPASKASPVAKGAQASCCDFARSPVCRRIRDA